MGRRMSTDAITTALDTVGLIAFAAGVAAGTAAAIGWFGLAVGGVVVLAGSWAVTVRADRSGAP